MYNKDKRNLMVYGKYIRQFNGARLNPEIRLTGKWLKSWGFKNGNIITVRKIESGLIIINTGVNIPPTIEL